MNIQENKERILKALDTMERVVQSHTGPNGATFTVIFEDFNVLRNSINNYIKLLEPQKEVKPGV